MIACPSAMSKGSDEAERHRIRDHYLSNPQVWNKYAYVLNDPLNNTDPDGRRSLNQDRH